MSTWNWQTITIAGALLAATAGTASASHHEDAGEGAAAENMEALSLDPTVVAPDVYKVLLEDERVRILDMKLEPGQTDGKHSHPAEAAYFIAGGKAKIELPDGKAMELEIADGMPLSHEAWTHTVSNIGDTTIHAIVFELKRDVGTHGMVSGKLDPTEVAPKVYKVLLEDERVRMLEMTLKRKKTDGRHAHPDEAAYFLSGGKVRITPAEGEPVEMEVPDGAPLSHEAWEHTVKNIGKSTIHAIVVEMK